MRWFINDHMGHWLPMIMKFGVLAFFSAQTQHFFLHLIRNSMRWNNRMKWATQYACELVCACLMESIFKRRQPKLCGVCKYYFRLFSLGIVSIDYLAHLYKQCAVCRLNIDIRRKKEKWLGGMNRKKARMAWLIQARRHRAVISPAHPQCALVSCFFLFLSKKNNSFAHN